VIRAALLAALLAVASSTAVAGPRQDLEARYSLGDVRDGSRRWSDRELSILTTSLGALDGRERKAVRGLTFVRMSAAGRPFGAGLFKVDRKGRKRILLYDLAFRGEDGRAKLNHAVLHEVGHAISAADLLRAERRMKSKVGDFNRLVDASNDDIGRYNAAVRRSNAGDSRARGRLGALRTAARASRRAAEAARPSAIEARRKYVALARDFKRRSPRQGIFDDYRRLLKGKRGPTRYGRTNLKESFAESFSLFKTDPRALRRFSPELLAWFERGGHTERLR